MAGDVFLRRRGRINARELWEQMMNTYSCLNLILACFVPMSDDVTRIEGSEDLLEKNDEPPATERYRNE